MSAILKFDFQKREQLRISEVNYLNYTKKDPILHVATTFSLKQGETRTSHGPIPHPLSRNDKLLLGEKSPSTYLGIIERGTDTIGFGRNYLGSSCLRYR